MSLAKALHLAAGELPITLPVSRHELAHAFRELGFTKGAEIGVWKGHYSEALCQANPGLRLICVDPWSPQPGYLEQKNHVEAMNRAHAEASHRLAPFPCIIVRETSLDAVRGFEDASLDFVYIDANHRYGPVLQDIAAWAPKVRAGGIVAGHDFIMRPQKNIEVEQAVRDYTSTHEIAPWFVLQSKADETPSWCWVKR